MRWIAALLFLAAMPAVAGAASGPELLSSDIVKGSLWGKEPPEGARLGRPAPTWFLEKTFSRLLSLPQPPEGFDTVQLDTSAWLLLDHGQVFGYLQKVPIDDWDSYELPARRRFGEPQRVHFSVDAATAPLDSPRFMHIYRWRDSVSEFLIIKMAPRSDTKRWREARTGTQMRLRILQKESDKSVPLYVAVLSAKRPKSARAPRGGGP